MKFQEMDIQVFFDREKASMAIDQYLAEQTGKTAFDAVVAVLASSLGDFEIKQFRVVVHKLDFGLACYKDDTIFISDKLFTKKVKIDKFEKIIKSIYHELSHHLIEKYNLKFLATKNLKYPYHPPFNFVKSYEFFSQVLGMQLDETVACTQYFYIKNKNENLARKNSVKYAQYYLDKFSMDYQFNIESYEKEMVRLGKDLCANFEILLSMPDFPRLQVEKYQAKTISNLSGCSDEDLKNLLFSFQLCFSNSTRQMLVNSLMTIKDNQKCALILRNPNVRITQEQKTQLSSVYGLFVTLGAVVEKTNTELNK
ncbi:MAG: hypothetical protein E7378_01695 [Clostridiales bacterium]|nr:hypothetical protein [Clostridiales bacterium]